MISTKKTQEIWFAISRANERCLVTGSIARENYRRGMHDARLVFEGRPPEHNGPLRDLEEDQELYDLGYQTMEEELGEIAENDGSEVLERIADALEEQNALLRAQDNSRFLPRHGRNWGGPASH